MVIVHATTYRVEFSKLMAKGNDFLFIKGIQDNYGNKVPTTKVPLTVVNDVFEATAVDVNPGLNATSVDGDEYFTITFSNNIDSSSIVDGWNGTNSKNISLIATKGKGEEPDTLSLGKAGTITFLENAITAGGAILGTVSMPNPNQIKVILSDSATTAKFVPTENIMIYNASPALASVDGTTVNSNILISVGSNNFLTVESF